MNNKITSFIKPHNMGQSTIRLSYIEQFHELIQDGDVYEFGVYSGISIKNILEKYRKFNLKCNVWGFDSFCGLPKELKEGLAYKEWAEGEFSSCDYLDIKDPKIAAGIIKTSVANEYPEYPIEMIVGFYEESLKTAYNKEMKPASWLDIDVDLYSSTLEVLEFMITNKLIIPGTIIYYDDWKGISLGEGRAHIEMCQKYGLKVQKLIGDGEVLFRVFNG